jgi:hypothetical protein
MANPVAGIWWFPGIVQRDKRRRPANGQSGLLPPAAPFRNPGNFTLLLVRQ